MTPPTLLGARGITLNNPWAHAVAWHGKDVENRGWMPWPGVDVLLIHAGKKHDPVGRQALDALGLEYGTATASAVVAVADLAFACNTARWQQADCGCGAWALPGHCHWKLTNVRPLVDPVPATGKQSLWTPTPQLLEAVADQLARGEAPAAPNKRSPDLNVLDFDLLQAVARGAVYRTETGVDRRSGGNEAFRTSAVALVNAGLVQLVGGRTATIRGRQRTVGGTYELTTPAGRDALDGWLATRTDR